MQYTIEARQLTSKYDHRLPVDVEGRRTTVEARDADDAIWQFVRQNSSELVSYARPGTGRESIATVKMADTMFLVRIYTA